MECIQFFSVKGKLGIQMIYLQSAFTNLKPIVKIILVG
jgi:hypothetical protein